MNKDRRKNLQAVIDAITEANETLETLKEEEEEYRDNMPENLQDSERYEKADAACDSLDEAISNLEEAIGDIETAIE